MNACLSPEFKTFVNTLKLKWQKIGDFIKESEEILKMSEDANILMWTHEEMCLEWDHRKKRITLTLNGFKKPLLEHKGTVREKVFPHLERFVYKHFNYKQKEAL